VNAYQEIAAWRASIERLLSFTDAIDATRARLERPGGVRVEPGDSDALRLSELHLELPSGRPLLDARTASIAPGEHVVVVGPSGAGQTTLLRAIAGHWPFGSGRVELPAGARTLFLSQQPYLPIATLRDAVSYPDVEGTFSDEKIREVLALFGLDELAEKLDLIDHWEKRLSGGEQQRLALARVLLHEPGWVFLDDATSALDEETERRAYATLEERLPHATVVSIAHRPAVERYHARRWTLVRRREGPAQLLAA
jgi:putative ATP-binding cassette transporter